MAESNANHQLTRNLSDLHSFKPLDTDSRPVSSGACGAGDINQQLSPYDDLPTPAARAGGANLVPAATAPTLLEAALRYQALGCTVLPILKGEKKSGRAGWQDYRPSPADLRRDYDTGKYGGIALRPGALSQNLVILDCDGEPVYTAFCEQFPVLVDTYTEKSGSGKGYHLFFQAERLPGSGKITRKGIFNTADLGFEMFYDSGAVVVAPSTHPSGEHYAVYKPLPVLHVTDLDAVVRWALALETKTDRDRAKRQAETPSRPPTPHTGETAPRNGEIAPALIADIEHALGVKRYKADGWSQPIPCLLTQHEHDATKPAAAWHRDKHIFKCLKCEATLLAHETAEALHLNWRDYYDRPTRNAAPKPTSVDFPTLAADISLNQPFITRADLPTDTAIVALKSDTGTGKTKTAIRVFKHARSAIYLTHRERLAENFSQEAQRVGVMVEHYKDLKKADRRKPPRLAICINSYSALADEAPGLPVPELLFIDEFEQLLAHVYTGETFTGRGAVDAAEALKYVLIHAQRVVVADAHLSELALDYLKALGREIVTVVNTYTPQRGALTIHTKRDGALSRGIALVQANEGVIAFPHASEQRAQTTAAELVELLGDGSNTLCIRAENAGGDRQRAFLTDPNGQIEQYRAVPFSPVIGTGFDITAPVRAVVGIMAAHLTAYDARQMIGRCRNTPETHVFLPTTSSNLEENAAQIEIDELQKAERTIRKLTDAGVLTTEIDPAQRNYLRWHARVMARRNWSINHLCEHFISLCAGYTISFAETADPELTAQLEAIKEARTAQLKELALTAAPLDKATYERLRDAGKIDDLAIAGHQRWQVETVIGVTISPAVRDALWTPDQRHVVRNFADLYDEIAELKVADAQETADGIPLHQRHHRTLRRVIVAAVLRLLMADGELLTLSDADLESSSRPLIERYGGDLRRLFGWRPDQCHRAAAILKRVLRTVGLTLDSEQVRIDGVKTRVYRLTRATWDRVFNLAAQRLALLRQKRREQYSPTPVLKSTQPASIGENVTFETPPRQGMPRREWGGASRLNPFSQPAPAVHP